MNDMPVACQNRARPKRIAKAHRRRLCVVALRPSPSAPSAKHSLLLFGRIRKKDLKGGILFRYSLIPFTFSKTFIKMSPMMIPAAPCTAFAGIFTNDGPKPYKNPSNKKYPKIITISANTAPIS